MYTRKDEITAGWILGILALALTGVILFWYLSNPQNFIKNGLGIQEGVFSNPIVAHVYAIRRDHHHAPLSM